MPIHHVVIIVVDRSSNVLVAVVVVVVLVLVLDVIALVTGMFVPRMDGIMTSYNTDSASITYTLCDHTVI
jgi:hypothetical protein